MKRLTTLLALVAILIPLHAQIRGYNITVSVTPDHKDWNYTAGEKANFVVNVRKSGTLLDNVDIDYEAGPVMYPDVKKSHVKLSDGTMKWTGTMKTPGFYRLKVTAHVEGKDYVGMCTAGLRNSCPPRSARQTSTNSGERPSPMHGSTPSTLT